MKMLIQIFVCFLFLGSSVAFAQTKQKVGTVSDGKKAAQVLKEVLAAYGTGNVNFIRDHLDPQMIGLQKLLDDVAFEASQCKQLRVHLSDTQIQAGPETVVIQSNWEKRCLKMPTVNPQLFTGHATFMLQKSGTGWVINGISGANPLAASLPTSR